jgi:hypothetical protein
MGELSFLTIIVSLAVCSLLVYAVFQYMKVRLTILEQSHKEQALILQQFIEESSTDIHRLYQMNSSSSSSHNDTAAQYGGGHHGSIILEYANENANTNRPNEYEEKPSAYNAPHMIHLDTAIFQNKRVSNLIEISSDSEDTTDSEEGSCEDESSSSDESSSDDERSDDERSDESSSSDESIEPIVEIEDSILGAESVRPEPGPEPESAPETKMITVDLGAIQESFSTSLEDQPLDVLAMLYKKSHDTPDELDVVAPVTESFASSSSVAHTPSITGLSVTELRVLLKEKHPEKHAEIQKMKKAELIQALQ